MRREDELYSSLQSMQIPYASLVADNIYLDDKAWWGNVVHML